MSTTTAEHNLAAECRAVEEGHRCRLDRERGVFLVRSDSRPVTYELRASGVSGYVVVTCTCPAHRHGTQRSLGTVPCKHAALVCRRLEREGLARFDGRVWRITSSAERLANEAPTPDEDDRPIPECVLCGSTGEDVGEVEIHGYVATLCVRCEGNDAAVREAMGWS